MRLLYTEFSICGLFTEFVGQVNAASFVYLVENEGPYLKQNRQLAIENLKCFVWA
jgi:hypothetical protein